MMKISQENETSKIRKKENINYKIENFQDKYYLRKKNDKENFLFR